MTPTVQQQYDPSQRCVCGDTRGQHGGAQYDRAKWKVVAKWSGRCHARHYVTEKGMTYEAPCWCLAFVGA